MSYTTAIGKKFRELVKLWRNEREKEELQSIREDLLPKVKKNIERLKSQIREEEETLSTSLARKEIEIVEFLLNDIIHLRIIKILKRLLQSESLDSLLPQENVFCEEVKNDIQELKDHITVSRSDESFSTLQLKEKIKKSPAKKNFTLVCANRSINSFVTEKGVAYRKIRKGDILNIPKKNLKLFQKKDRTLFDKIDIKGEEKENE